MGIVYADITLRNAGDKREVKCGLIKKHEIRQTAVRALVDTGAGTLVINDWVCAKLGLDIENERPSTLADNSTLICKVSEPVEVEWNGRKTVCPAIIMPGNGDVLLGAIPLEDMDLIVNPSKQELIGAHGDDVVALIK